MTKTRQNKTRQDKKKDKTRQNKAKEVMRGQERKYVMTQYNTLLLIITIRHFDFPF